MTKLLSHSKTFLLPNRLRADSNIMSHIENLYVAYCYDIKITAFITKRARKCILFVNTNKGILALKVRSIKKYELEQFSPLIILE